ncbi:MAG: hypothetical protein JXX14_08570 [Deltaproteobacteria bacterium]|nr:hypothetical protein [Deltaproteobacteria bacterium]
MQKLPLLRSHAAQPAAGPGTCIILIIALIITLFHTLSARAADSQTPTASMVSLPAASNVPPPPPPPGVAPVAPSASDNSSAPAELLQVEAVVGGNLSREWKRYQALSEYRPDYGTGFANFLYDEYSRRRTSGILMAGVGAPLIAGFTAMGIVALYRRGLDNGGFCNHREYDEQTGGYEETCEGDYGPMAGILLLSMVGGAATMGLFIPGLIKSSRYNKRLRRLAVLVTTQREGDRRVGLIYAIGPRYATFGIQF